MKMPNGTIGVRGIAALYLFVEITTFMINKFVPDVGLDAAHAARLNRIHEIVNFTDPSGRPLVYLPGSHLENQVEMIALLKSIALNQIKEVKLLQRDCK